MIRPATNADLKSIYNIVSESSPCELDYQMFARTYLSQLENFDHKLGVCEENGEIVGFVGVLCTWQLYMGARVAEIKDLAVAKAHQDHDVRDQLLAWAEGVAHDTGCGRISMCSVLKHEESHEFYEKHGFKKIFYRFDKNIEE
ncbi:PhnO protein [Bifidobacterium bohemicum]|uniref:Aminoalkylphosphonic acid N-acetyltransferase n=1 Tax=Bifidobacterium bohemicum DSM 22767 TaxID=1437606 RepID=A0A086ZGW9_9BIFI|nr:GNAT family N-acetyltransferase [Bifidobacterium bohemicum]KFI45769.1 aminoalkylphosphonic acid N-acetyltransferase [Bifidobacterium bohemicum DSM 22767]SCC11558.1 PhnO protein [Bifidobacterium bohemicum]